MFSWGADSLLQDALSQDTVRVRIRATVRVRVRVTVRRIRIGPGTCSVSQG